MIGPEVRHRIDRAGPDERVSLLVVVRQPTLEELERATAAETTRRAKLESAARLYAGAKRRLLEELEATPDVEVRDLPSGPGVAVTASGETWRRLARPGAFLDVDPDTELAPEARFAPY